MLNVHAYAAKQPKAPLESFHIPRRQPGPHDVLIEIEYCGVCHSDVHQAREEWGSAIFPMVPGHEIVGKVTQIGQQVSRYRVGDTVGVGCFVDSCRTCHSCHMGIEQYCEKGKTLTYNCYEKDGKTPTYGGYSTHIVVDENYVLRIPKELPLDKAAPLLCAGITTYSPLRHWKVRSGQHVGVIGLGGLGHMAVKLASAMGAEVTLFSHSDKKKDDALRFGAKKFVNTHDPQALGGLERTFDLIINTVSAEIDLNAYLSALKTDASLVLLGIPEKPILIKAGSLIGGRRNLSGSLIGGIQETQEMLDFCAAHHVTPEVELIPIQKINEAYERMVRSDVRYRFVIDIQSLKEKR